MATKVNIHQVLNNIQDYFSPRIIGEVNDVFIKLAKIKGDEIPWHNHHDEDEMFYILSGTLLFEEENKDSMILSAGDMYIVNRGVNHKVSSKEECQIMLIENKSTQHTGDVIVEITKTIKDQLYELH